MKFVPLGSSLKSTQINPKLLHLLKIQRSYETYVKTTHTFTLDSYLITATVL